MNVKNESFLGYSINYFSYFVYNYNGNDIE